MNERKLNHFVVGKLGNGIKSIVFRKDEFKKELAPSHAIIDEFEVNGEERVRMQYKV